MADIVVAVAAEILGRKFPVARDAPFLDAAHDLGAALTADPAVQGQIEIADKLAEIFEEGRRFGVPAGPYSALVAAQLRDFDQAPLQLVELLVIGLAKIGDADELAVSAVTPPVIRAGEDRRVAVVVAADLHSAVSAGIQEHMDLAGAVAAQDHRL